MPRKPKSSNDWPETIADAAKLKIFCTGLTMADAKGTKGKSVAGLKQPTHCYVCKRGASCTPLSVLCSEEEDEIGFPDEPLALHSIERRVGETVLHYVSCVECAALLGLLE